MQAMTAGSYSMRGNVRGRATAALAALGMLAVVPLVAAGGNAVERPLEG